ncbi:SGT1 protein-domain-containing protein [Zychaea mexicana]|uniref:SGT1 protein-domain-containing protein n=1 Tax=Zychaea mexicana TaxID=64656 RepID=UPI0022FE2713|nr:SGT1 protein-domain-containing protein [Zychaea mexicana]KAI9477077.1 SGT1 protein-domain-containing protein [Zychaea mexicana]
MDSLQDVFEGAATIEENAIQYSIFFPVLSDPDSMLDRVQDSLAMIRSLVQPHINDYLWQKDQFYLAIVHDDSKDPGYPYLHGITHFGDCIHDEWFIVYLLRLITEKIANTVATLYDNDGDVLLIEAAMALPAWLDPSNSQNRVALYKGDVHIIPMPRTPADLIQVPVALTQARAVEIIRNPRIETRADAAIQEVIDARKATHDERHLARCTLPAHAAYVLLQHPQLLPLAVEAFYLRDPVGLKACSTMRRFPPNDSVTTTVKFTKTTYAQTVSQKFYPPKPFHLPKPSNKRSFFMAELGMKVACGLEMLYYQSSSIDANVDEEAQKTKSIAEDPKYKQFLSRLTRLGYFRQERSGSKLYRELEQQAQQQYREMRRDVDDPETFAGSQVLPNPHKTIDNLLSTYSEEALDKLLKANPDIEDNDDWMNVDPQQLEELLNQRMGQMQNGMMADFEREINDEDDDPMPEGGVDLDKMMSQFANFIEGSKSGLDGVDFPGEEEEDEDDSDYEGEEDVDASLSFDAERFMNILTNVLGPAPGVPVEQKEQEQPLQKEEKDRLDEEEEEDVIKQMDEEINAQEKLGSFAKQTDDVDAPVDVSLNLVKNILESYKSQQGLPGPAGNILGQFGIVLPADDEEDDDDDDHDQNEHQNVHNLKK